MLSLWLQNNCVFYYGLETTRPPDFLFAAHTKNLTQPNLTLQQRESRVVGWFWDRSVFFGKWVGRLCSKVALLDFFLAKSSRKEYK